MSEKLTPDQRDKANELIEAAQDDLEGVIFKLVAELAAMTARAEIAERQVAMLCGHIEDYGSCWNCPAKSLGAACSYSGESCRDALAAWYRAEAVKEGGKG